MRKATPRATPTKLEHLIQDPENRRKHTPRNLEMIEASLKAFGAGRSVLINGKNKLIAGNGVVRAAKKAGIKRVRVIDTAGDEIIAIRRKGLTAAHERDLAIFDNRSAELAEWNVEQLRVDLADGANLGQFFSTAELQELLERADNPKQGKTDPDSVPERRATSIKTGEIFALGAHRIACGDSTEAGLVRALLGDAAPHLMVTDPPYGVSYDPAWRAEAGVNRNKKKMGKATNDDRADWAKAWRLFPGSVAYVYHADRMASIVQSSLERERFAIRCQIIWAKDRLVLSRGDYHWQHEPCWYAVRAGQTGKRTKDRSQSTLWRIATGIVSTLWEIPSRDDDGHTHGTQKPVECMERPMRNHLSAEVYDPFLGSGTTIIAAEMLGRKCFALELEPSYVQVAIDRWEAFTGKKAAKIQESAATRAAK